jgi:Right handed beta helix region
MRLLPLLLLFAATPSLAAIYQVGPGRTYTHLNALFAAVDLNGGDEVWVDGNTTYPGGVIIPAADGGSPGNPVIIKPLQAGTYPRLDGSGNTLEFRQSNHVVFEGFEITGGTARCVLMGAHDVTIRDVKIHNCAAHGILSTDQQSGSLTLEFSEIYDAGAGTSQHALYIQSDEVAYPGSVFRMRHNYVHSANGGNLLKCRHERAEIHYNWFEGAAYHELELIGPDEAEQQAGWTRDLIREDQDVVGNVIVHSNPAFGAVVRVGGDGSGVSKGRARFVNNTFLLTSGADTTVFRIFQEMQSVEMHNNVIDVTAGGTARIIRAVDGELVWTDGRQIRGSNNWIETGSSFVPAAGEWSGTLSGTSPGFINAAAYDLRPGAASPLRNAGNNTPASNPAFAFPGPLYPPQFEAPRRVKPGNSVTQPRPADGLIDIGAQELASDAIFADGFQ